MQFETKNKELLKENKELVKVNQQLNLQIKELQTTTQNILLSLKNWKKKYKRKVKTLP